MAVLVTDSVSDPAFPSILSPLFRVDVEPSKPVKVSLPAPPDKSSVDVVNDMV